MSGYQERSSSEHRNTARSATPGACVQACAAGPPRANGTGLHPVTDYERWETAIRRLQAVLACTPECPLAPLLLQQISQRSANGNPLAAVFPEFR